MSIDKAIRTLCEEVLTEKISNFDFEEVVNNCDFSDKIEEAVNNYDFTEIVEEAVNNYDFTEIVEEAVNNYDFSDKAEDAIANHDFTEVVEEAINIRYFSDKISDKVEMVLSTYDFSDHDLSDPIENAVGNRLKALESKVEELQKKLEAKSEAPEAPKTDADKAQWLNTVRLFGELEKSLGNMETLTGRYQHIASYLCTQFEKLLEDIEPV
jgi:hypothetical protein